MNHSFINTLFHTILALSAIYAGVPLVQHIFMPLRATTKEEPGVPIPEEMAEREGFEMRLPSADVPPIKSLITVSLTVLRAFATLSATAIRPAGYLSGTLRLLLRPLLIPLRLAFLTLPLSILSLAIELLAPLRFALRVVFATVMLPIRLFICTMRYLFPLYVFFVAAGTCGVVLGAGLGYVVEHVQYTLGRRTPRPIGAKAAGKRKGAVNDEHAAIWKEQKEDMRSLTRLRIRRQTARMARKHE
jgi:hypothetical protein